MKKILIVLICELAWCLAIPIANAWPVHGSAAPSGLITLNIGQAFNSGTGLDYPWINYMKQWTPNNTVRSDGGPSYVDDNGYPVATLAANWTGQLNSISTTLQTGATKWVLRWTGQCGTSTNCFQGSFASTVTSDPGGCVQGSTAVNTRLRGTNCRIEFTWSAATPDPTFLYLAGGELNGTVSNLALYRLSDETAYLASMASGVPFGGFNPDYIAALRAIGPQALRFVNFNCVNPTINIQSTVAMQTPVAAQGYLANYYNSLWAGSTTAGGGAAAAYQVTAPGGVTTPTSGMAMQLKFANAGTGAMTLSIDGGVTNIPIGSIQGIATPGAGGGILTSISAGTVYSMVYDSILNMWLTSNGGIASCTPVEVMIALANAVNASMWYNVPMLASDALISNIATKIKNGLNSTSLAIFEYSNETWNFGYYGSKLGQFRGTALGIGSSPELSWAALRARQMFGLINTVYAGQSNYRLVLAGQAVNPTLFNSRTYLGSQLNPSSNSALCSYLGGTFSGTCSGAPNYSASPNRPGDLSDWSSYAAYWFGGQTMDLDLNYTNVQGAFTVTSGTSTNPVELTTSTNHGYTTGQRAYLGLHAASGRGTNFTGTGWVGLNSSTINGKVVTVTAANKFTVPVDATGFPAYSGNGGSVARFADEFDGLLAAADAFASSGTVANACNGLSTPVAWMDCDMRSGTNYGTLGSGTLDSFNTNIYPVWETNAASFDAGRAGLGKAAIKIALYEGAMQSVAPVAATCTTVGIDSAYCGNTGKIANLLGWTSSPAAGAYKTTSLFQVSTKRQLDQFMAGGGTIGAWSHSLYPAWLLLVNGSGSNCSGVWALYVCDIYTGSTYKSYDAVRNYRYPFLLKRDLAPASNDNDPMWLEKAA